MSIYAVNGKEPIAAWIPSLDTAGNGTTTLTDLVGSNNGTLTDMDPATDWVADTGAGGVRALDFDGVNDYVNCGQSAADLTEAFPITISMWCKPLGNMGTFGGLVTRAQSSPHNIGLRWRDGVLQAYIRNSLISGSTLTLDAWQHVLAVFTNSSITIYQSGVQTNTITHSESLTANADSLHIGSDFTPGSGRTWWGRQDDIRIFDQALTASDVSALYAAGNGRGITFGGTTIQTRRRRDLGGYGL